VECRVASTTVDRIFGKKGEVHLSSLLDVCKFLGIKLYAERD
jgi:DNA-binding phage protein